MTKVKAALRKKLVDGDDVGNNNPETTTATDEKSNPIHSFENLMENIATKNITPPTVITKDPFDVLFDEYCDAPLLPMNDEPLLFWKEWSMSGNPLKKKFSDFAVEKLTPPATSVEAERFFSTAGDVVPKEANRTNPENLEKKLFCHNNLPKVDYEY